MKFKLDDEVFISGLGGKLEGACGTILSTHEYAPNLYKHIVMLKSIWWTEEYKAVTVPSCYLLGHNMNIYQEEGYESRLDYLRSVAEEYGMPYNTVICIANLYGESEDFDGLLTALEDM
jgi:hypothetical protein